MVAAVREVTEWNKSQLVAVKTESDFWLITVIPNRRPSEGRYKNKGLLTSDWPLKYIRPSEGHLQEQGGY